MLTNQLCRKLWTFNLPSKVKLFWWKVMHNGLPTLVNLQIRGTPVDITCPLCTEQAESLDHLIFRCRVTKEIWSLIIPQIFRTRHMSTIDFLDQVWKSEKRMSSPLIAFIGWCIWKARNELVFRQSRMNIPDILSQIKEEHRMWGLHNQTQPSRTYADTNGPSRNTTNSQEQSNGPKCFVEAHWTSKNSNIGVGWILLRQGTPYLQGYGAFPPAANAKNAKTIAIYQTVQQILNIGPPNTTILASEKSVIDMIQRSIAEGNHPKEGPDLELSAVSTTPCIEDIRHRVLTSKSELSFRYIEKGQNMEAANLAKTAQLQNVDYTISWLNL